MTIETKYNIGDEVWAMCLNRPTTFTVRKIYVIKDDIDLKVQYLVGTCTSTHYYEQDLFPTKEELLKSL